VHTEASKSRQARKSRKKQAGIKAGKNRQTKVGILAGSQAKACMQTGKK
jgi:hypothetical protein